MAMAGGGGAVVQMQEPWSKRHKLVTRAGSGGMPHNLSNSFAQPLSQPELVEYSLARGDKELVDAYSQHQLGYTPNGGSLDLREQISRLYGPQIGPENVLVFPGAQVALQTAAFALAADCHSIVFTPGYQSTIESPAHAGGRVTKIQLRASNGWQIDPQEVRAAIRADTRYMVLNEPYNPGGTLMSAALQAELIELAAAHGVRILCDGVRSPTPRLRATFFD
jgi:aspartate/methionine/tyrosine aminotransferase